MDKQFEYQDDDWSLFTSDEASSQFDFMQNLEEELHISVHDSVVPLTENPQTSFSELYGSANYPPAPARLNGPYESTVAHPVGSAFGATLNFDVLNDSTDFFPSDPDAMFPFTNRPTSSPNGTTSSLGIGKWSALGSDPNPEHTGHDLIMAPPTFANHFPAPSAENTAMCQHSTSTRPSRSQISTICTVQITNNGRTFIFRCEDDKCRGKRFGRWFDFHRHYNGAHAIEKTVFWCPIAECNRSEGENNKPFPRRDKMMDHVEKIHGIEDDESTEFED